MSVFARATARIERRLTAARRRSGVFDHVWRARQRYGEVLGGRLAAAIAYYGFFAVFALGLVAYAVFGAIIEESDEISSAVGDFLRQNLPFLDLAEVRRGSGNVGVAGLVLLVFTGVGWVEAIRSSQRLVYDLEQQPGKLVVRRLVDLAVLVGVFLLLGLSVAAVDAVRALLGWLLGGGGFALTVVSSLLSVLVNVVLAAALLVAVPRLRMTVRRLLPPVLLVASGITLLNTVGRLYVVRWERNPAYTVVAGAVGLLIYLYLLNQLLLFGAALAATARDGEVTDLAAGRPRAPRPAGPPRTFGRGRSGYGRVANRRTPASSGEPTTRRGGCGHDGRVGALVTLELPDDSPVLDLPWIITFGPLRDEDDWEPVVCGPYERPHALALAESVVADEELMAVVEPLLSHVSPDEIRDEIVAAKMAAEDEAVAAEGADLYGDYEDVVEEELEEVPDEERRVEPSAPPTPEEIRAGFARIAARLTESGA